MTAAVYQLRRVRLPVQMDVCRSMSVLVRATWGQRCNPRNSWHCMIRLRVGIPADSRPVSQTVVIHINLHLLYAI